MTYKIEQFVSKITSPVIVKTGDENLTFNNGTELAEHTFDRKYLVTDINTDGTNIVLTLVENERVNDINWVGEEQAGFF